jgi:hypothetical protein
VRVRFKRARRLVGRVDATGRNVFHHVFLAPRRCDAVPIKASAMPAPGPAAQGPKGGAEDNNCSEM